MDYLALLGIVCILYFVFCLYIALAKPPKIWRIKKIQGFVKVLGEKGAVTFFIVWGTAIGALGAWLMMK